MLETLCGFDEWYAKHGFVYSEKLKNVIRIAFKAGVLAGIRMDITTNPQPIINWIYNEMEQSK